MTQMAFENLSERIQKALKNLTGKGKISEEDINRASREIRLALLEADVNFKVVKDFIKTIKKEALGKEVQESLNPGQQVIKIVNDELTKMMGEDAATLNKSRTAGMMNGNSAYHVDPNGTDVTGVTFPSERPEAGHRFRLCNDHSDKQRTDKQQHLYRKRFPD